MAARQATASLGTISLEENAKKTKQSSVRAIPAFPQKEKEKIKSAAVGPGLEECLLSTSLASVWTYCKHADVLIIHRLPVFYGRPLLGCTDAEPCSAGMSNATQGLQTQREPAPWSRHNKASHIWVREVKMRETVTEVADSVCVRRGPTVRIAKHFHRQCHF